jgi:hypothetical protein
LAREWVRDGLAQWKRSQRKAGIREFVTGAAQTSLDLDTALEGAGIESITGDDNETR